MNVGINNCDFSNEENKELLLKTVLMVKYCIEKESNTDLPCSAGGGQ